MKHRAFTIQQTSDALKQVDLNALDRPGLIALKVMYKTLMERLKEKAPEVPPEGHAKTS